MSDRLLLVVAPVDDSAVGALSRCAPGRVAHASVSDLCSAGWRYQVGAPERATARADGRSIEAARIAAVVCRIPRVTADDLVGVHADDREYAAAEITAFLRTWLAQFRGVRCNEPTWASLAGSFCDPRLVEDLNIPVTANEPTATAIVAGRDVFGVTEPELIGYSLRIASAVKARSLAVRFARDRRWCFNSAEACPELDATSAPALLRDLLTGIA